MRFVMWAGTRAICIATHVYIRSVTAKYRALMCVPILSADAFPALTVPFSALSPCTAAMSAQNGEQLGVRIASEIFVDDDDDGKVKCAYVLRICQSA